MSTFDSLHWKDVAIAAILVIQGLISVMFFDLKGTQENHESRIDDNASSIAIINGNRFTASDAIEMQIIFLREMQLLKDGISDDISSLRSCINTNVVEGRRQACQ